MPLTNAFTRESRQDIVKSIVNRSTSKQFWSFPKRNHRMPSGILPDRYLNYLQTKDELSSQQEKGLHINHRCSFARDLRGSCYIKNTSVYSGSQQRSMCLQRICVSIISTGMYVAIQHPGPSDYVPQQPRKQKGYSFRPKTAHHRNYFIDDKEQKDVPGPFQYHIFVDHEGKTCSSKFKSSTLGQSLRKTQPRFSQTEIKTPGPSLYHPRTVSLRNDSVGGAIGGTLRKSFIDCIKMKTEQPGPGNYELPSEFGHYKASSRAFSRNQIVS